MKAVKTIILTMVFILTMCIGRLQVAEANVITHSSTVTYTVEKGTVQGAQTDGTVTDSVLKQNVAKTGDRVRLQSSIYMVIMSAAFLLLIVIIERKREKEEEF